MDPSPRSRFQCAFVDQGRDGDVLQRHASRVEYGDLLVSRSSLFPARHDRAEFGVHLFARQRLFLKSVMEVADRVAHCSSTSTTTLLRAIRAGSSSFL